MKQILCYGDSNTWGYRPDSKTPSVQRFLPEERWTGVAQAALGTRYHIIEEGLGGRTTSFGDHTSPGRDGAKWLLPCLQTHEPLDLVLFMLGTNDCKPIFGACAVEIARGMELLIQIAANPCHYGTGCKPSILVVAPILIGKEIPNFMNGVFDESSAQKAGELASRYRELAQKYGCGFLDASQYAGPGCDCIHLDAVGHRALGMVLADQIKTMLENETNPLS